MLIYIKTYNFKFDKALAALASNYKSNLFLSSQPELLFEVQMQLSFS